MANRIYPVVEVAQAPSSARARFRRWVGIYGVSRLSRSLNTDRKVVHKWTHREKPVTPCIKNIRKIIALSTIEPLNNRPLTYQDIIGPIKISSHTTRVLGRVRPFDPRPVMIRRVL